MKEFKNKVAAITGSATGIGRAFAEEAAKRGMRLALIDINTEGLEETKAICEKAGAPKVALSQEIGINQFLTGVLGKMSNTRIVFPVID